jgi:hypothetical protein
MKLTGQNRSTRGETGPIATLYTTNPTWTDPGSNPGFRVERPMTNYLIHGTAWTNLASLLHVHSITAVLGKCRRLGSLWEGRKSAECINWIDFVSWPWNKLPERSCFSASMQQHYCYMYCRNPLKGECNLFTWLALVLIVVYITIIGENW